VSGQIKKLYLPDRDKRKKKKVKGGQQEDIKAGGGDNDLYAPYNYASDLNQRKERLNLGKTNMEKFLLRERTGGENCERLLNISLTKGEGKFW